MLRRLGRGIRDAVVAHSVDLFRLCGKGGDPCQRRGCLLGILPSLPRVQEMDKVPTAESEWVVWLAERVIDEVVLTIQVEEHP